MANEEYIRVKSGYLEIRQKVGAGVISKSGKSLNVVSTGGFKPVDDTDMKVNLTVIKPKG